MEQIKLHKQGGAAVIIIPASMIENTGWEDGTLLEVLEINETLHIRRKTESGALGKVRISRSFLPKQTR
ncbi:hypothetical protein MWL73_24605 [Escherichia coli]|nr:hypothetical protein [Escherichia coli]